ncbi:3'-5' exonuclease, putative [Plasmodium ovale]|uniref:3'-5' exonuclease, putative n=2 Tax=Plasmodium ovale TaxID=36330 RepID=A0A1D3RDC0_PLAOA|nr:3'-5' exonuclease, putative [Plasmodium ovale]
MYVCSFRRVKRMFIRRASSVSYGYLRLTVSDRIVSYFQKLNKKIVYIEDWKECKKYVEEIKNNVVGVEKINCIGMDVEGYKIGKYGIVSIVQICAEDVYLFDVYKSNNSYLFMSYLRDLLESEDIIKVTHDCREDCSILYNQYNIHLKKVFDTQIAHSLILKKEKKDMYQVSYDDLLNKCLFLNNSHKIYFHKIISLDEKVYLKRPISRELINYAVQDVLYLKPLMRSLLDRLIGEEHSREVDTVGYTNNLNDMDSREEQRSNLIEYVMKQSEKYINYQFLNLHIKNEKQLQRGMKLDGMVVSCSNLNMYVKLNLSKRGVIRNYLPGKYKIGDMVKCVILDFSSNNYITLGLFDHSASELTCR